MRILTKSNILVTAVLLLASACAGPDADDALDPEALNQLATSSTPEPADEQSVGVLAVCARQVHVYKNVPIDGVNRLVLCRNSCGHPAIFVCTYSTPAGIFVTPRPNQPRNSHCWFKCNPESSCQGCAQG